MSVFLNLHHALLEKTRFEQQCLDRILEQTALKKPLLYDREG